MSLNLARTLETSSQEEADLSPEDIVRAWEDKRFRSRLSQRQLKRLPEHPVGAGRLIRLVEDPHMSGNNCSTDNCSGSNCSTNNCSTDNCSGSNCSTNNCSTNNCSSDNCSGSNCSGNSCSNIACSTNACGER